MDLVYVSLHSKAKLHGSAGHMEIVLIERWKLMWSNVINTLPGGEGGPTSIAVLRVHSVALHC